jgi:hypothetical protein
MEKASNKLEISSPPQKSKEAALLISKRDKQNQKITPKPEISRIDILSTSSTLSKLTAFLPLIKQANQTLTVNEGEGLEDVSSEDEHIEMNLGLGVFDTNAELDEQKTENSEHESQSEADDDEKEVPSKRLIEEI